MDKDTTIVKYDQSEKVADRDLRDSYGRRIDYLRISLTDKCNLRCRYCMPAEGVKQLAHTDVLSLEEIVRVSSVLTELGIRRIRLTGGEPLVRKGVTDLVRMLGSLPLRPELALTSNGVLLEDKLEAFYEAGLRSVNISLDTLDRENYARITGTDALPKVFASIDKALQLGVEVKVNVVPMRGINDADLSKIAELAKDRDICVRYIELMPIGCGRNFQGISGDEIRKALEACYGEAEPAAPEKVYRETLRSEKRRVQEYKHSKENVDFREADVREARRKENESCEADGRQQEKKDIVNGPAEYVRFPGFRGRVGFINPLSHRFCQSCNRIRLTADGRLKLCLYYPDGPDLRSVLRSGCSDEELKSVIRESVLKKPERHYFGSDDGAKEARRMYEIGG